MNRVDDPARARIAARGPTSPCIKRTAMALGALGLLAGASACGERGEPETSEHATTSAPRAPGPVGPVRPAGPYEREVISDDMEGKFAQVVFDHRDTPVAVGAKAPDIDGTPSQRTSVIVFFRGAW